jgi:hypothetical protein
LEGKLRRLTILIAVLTCIGFGGAYGYAANKASSWQRTAGHYGEMLRRSASFCTPERLSWATCTPEDITHVDHEFNSALGERDRMDEYAALFLVAAVAFPLTSFLMFFGGGWVLTGRLARRAASPETESTETTEATMSSPDTSRTSLGRAMADFARSYGLFVAIGVAAGVVNYLRSPDQFATTLIASLVSAVGLGVFAFIVGFARRSRRGGSKPEREKLSSNPFD